jgi:hypothetical protein
MPNPLPPPPLATYDNEYNKQDLTNLISNDLFFNCGFERVIYMEIFHTNRNVFIGEGKG